MPFAWIKANEPPPEAAAPAGNAPANTGTPGKRTPAERARLAALARWGKYKGAGKPKPKGRKPAQTPEAKEAARRQAAQANRAAVATEMGISTEDQASLDALAMGKPPGDTAALVKAGIVELGKDGTPRFTAAGKQFYNAAGRGDAGAAGDALSRGKDKAPQPKEAEPEAEKPKAGGGGGGGGGGAGKEKPTAEDKQTERQTARAKMAADTAGKVGLKDIDALRAARDEGGADSKELRALGLIDDAGDATSQGRSALTALELGNVGAYRAALQDAKGRMAREAAAATRTKDKDARALERAKRAQDKASAATTRRTKEQRGTRVITTRETKDMDYTDALERLDELADELEPAIKAGNRHNAADRALVQALFDRACDICTIALELGAEAPEDGDDEDETAIGETVEVLDDSVKMLSDGRIGGYAVRFGSADEPDLSELRDYFTKSTEFWLDHWATRPMLYHHAQDAATKAAPVVGTWTGATVDNVGVWLEGQLNKAHRYHAAIKELVQRGMLKLSSDSAPHLVIRERQPNGTNEIKRWPMLAASLTPTPAEPRLMAIDYIKALYAEAGLLPPVEIDDSPEATDADEPVEMALDAMKTGDGERARRLKATVDLLMLEAA